MSAARRRLAAALTLVHQSIDDMCRCATLLTAAGRVDEALDLAADIDWARAIARRAQVVPLSRIDAVERVAARVHGFATAALAALRDEVGPVAAGGEA